MRYIFLFYLFWHYSFSDGTCDWTANFSPSAVRTTASITADGNTLKHGQSHEIGKNSDYSASFGNVSGYFTPSNANINCDNDNHEWRYWEKKGYLNMTISPSTGKWRPTGTSTWHSSGTTYAVAISTNPQTITIEFSNDVSNYGPPANQNFTFSSEEIKTGTATYWKKEAYLTMTLNPSSGKWKPSGTSTWYSSGTQQTISIATNPDDITIEFLEIADYATPISQVITFASVETKSSSATYLKLVKNYSSVVGGQSLAAVRIVELNSNMQSSGQKYLYLLSSDANVYRMPIDSNGKPTGGGIELLPNCGNISTSTFNAGKAKLYLKDGKDDEIFVTGWDSEILYYRKSEDSHKFACCKNSLK